MSHNPYENKKMSDDTLVDIYRLFFRHKHNLEIEKTDEEIIKIIKDE